MVPLIADWLTSESSDPAPPLRREQIEAIWQVLQAGRHWYREGIRRRKTVYGRTRDEVTAKLTKLLRDAQQGLIPEGPRQTVAQFLHHWLDGARLKVRPRTYVTYQNAVERHLIPGIGQLQLEKLTAQRLQSWLTAYQKAGASARTIRYARAILRIALAQALRWNLVARNVATLVDVPRSPRHEVTPFTPEEARTFLDTVKGHRLEALFTVGVALGLRQGEILGLHWQDVDTDAGTLRVRTALRGFPSRKARSMATWPWSSRKAPVAAVQSLYRPLW
jgi:integrase